MNKIVYNLRVTSRVVTTKTEEQKEKCDYCALYAMIHEEDLCPHCGSLLP